MNAATEFDVGPLTWVKSEIDLALERAGEALGLFAAGGDATQIKFCRTHLHQVRGALAIVGLDGVTQFTDALESLLEKFEQRADRVAAEETVIIREALDAIHHYLDDLISGEPNQPLRLMPVYSQILAAKGEKKISATDLFFPDLTLRPPRRAATQPLARGELQQLLRAQRARFQRGLLAWLRNPTDTSGVVEMLAATRQVEATQELASSRAFWWVATGMLAALTEGALPAAVDVKQLCARIDLQIRRLQEGSKNVAERLMRDALYQVAQADSGSDLVRQVKSTYQLEKAIPEVDQVAAPHEQQRRRLRETISATEESWNKFCSGNTQALHAFRDNAAHLQQAVGQLGHTDYRRLAQAIANAANWLTEKPARHTDALAMEIATAILLAQNAQENFTRLGNDFAHQVDVMVARLHGFLAETPPEPGAEIPLLDEMSRQAQEKLLIGQVAREIQSNLAQIEQVLDGFFRDADKRSDLATLDAPLHQIVGALMIMGQDTAVSTLNECKAEIKRFAEEGYTPAETDFERVADKLSALGFFIDSMQHGATDFAEFTKAMKAGPVNEEEEVEGSVEKDLEAAKQNTQALLQAVKDQPTDARLRQELKQNLETLKQDADLVADNALGQQAKAMLSALDSDASAPAIDEALASIKPKKSDTPTPSSETMHLAQAAEEELDAELLEIFIEEAKEVLEAVGANLTILRGQPHNSEVLTNVRRSFHTLKGSGRMVGLRDLGEVAWEVEQTLNHWLRQELDVTPQVADLIADSHSVFSAWVEHLENHAFPVPETKKLTDLSIRLRTREEAAAEIESPPVVEQTPAIEADEESFDGAAATLVLGNFGEPAADPAPEPADTPFDNIELPPLSLDEPPTDDDEMFDGAAATLVLGRLGSDESEDHSAEVEEVVDLPPLFLDDAPQAPDDEDYDSAKTVVLRQYAAPEPAEPEIEAIEMAPLPLDDSDEALETLGEAPEIPPIDSIDSMEPQQPVSEQNEAVEITEVELPAVEALSLENFEVAEELSAIAEPEPLVAVDVVDQPEITAAEPTEQTDALESVQAIETTTDDVEANDEDRLQLSISPALYDIFLEEARSHLATLRAEFITLADDPTQPTGRQMARAAHTLAGISGTVGLADINRLGASLEHALLRRETTDKADSISAIEVLRQTIDALDEMVAKVAEMLNPQPAPHLVLALDDIYPLPAQTPDDNDDETQDLLDSSEETERVATTAASVPSIMADLPSVKDELDEQLLPIFLEEATELTEAINENLRNWRISPADDEIARSLHRLFHTLKGSARMAGAMTLGEITHAIESRVEQAAKAGSAPLELIDEIESTLDSVAQILERLQQGESLDISTNTETADENQEAELAEEGALVSAIVEGDTGSVAETTEETGAQRAMLRVRADLVDQLVNEAGELSIARARIEGEMIGLKGSLLDLTENVIRLRRQLRDIEIQAESQMQSRIAQTDEKHAGFDPLEFDRFTRFQELTRMMAESVNDVATVQQNLLKNHDDATAAILAQARMNRQLQQELMAIRMVPFSSQAERLYRIVRQTAKEIGKRANLEIRGGQVELDRSVLDKIGAPLEHLLRNAVAHGLEDRTTRINSGKTEIGEVTLTLAQEGNEIILTMADDGAGLNFERIRARGIESGLLGEDEEADEGRLIKLIFTPGFSTASEVNQIAGRGIGMDVVKTEVGELGGRIEVLSNAGKGSTFRLYIPLTLAVTQALLVRTGSHSYAIPSPMIEQVLELKEAFLARIREAGEAEWLGNKYPYRFLPHLLGDSTALPEARRQYWVLLLRSGQQRIAIQVDELKGNREIVVKNIGQQLSRVVGIDGATVLGDGQVVLILNPVALASRSRALHIGETSTGVMQTQAPASDSVSTLPTVLIVDDSLTVRKITGRLLAREGYQVLTAKDGVDALEQMLDIIPDVLLVDIEMPRMDGFDLTRNVRADDKLKHVPIVMITSRTADKHRNYAFEIGVNNYLGKPYQEDELLELVGEYTKAKRIH